MKTFLNERRQPVNNYNNPFITIWEKLSNYYKVTEHEFCRKGATYGIIFNDVKPKSYQQPCMFESCVYIGQSAGLTDDSKHLTCNLTKRISTHKAALSRGTNSERRYKVVINEYRFTEEDDIDFNLVHKSGLDLDGKVTGSPWWIGLVCPNPEIPNYMIKSWCCQQEQIQLYNYMGKHQKAPLGNLQANKRMMLYEDEINLEPRNPSSKAYRRLQSHKTLIDFL